MMSTPFPLMSFHKRAPPFRLILEINHPLDKAAVGGELEIGGLARHAEGLVPILRLESQVRQGQGGVVTGLKPDLCDKGIAMDE